MRVDGWGGVGCEGCSHGGTAGEEEEEEEAGRGGEGRGGEGRKRAGQLFVYCRHYMCMYTTWIADYNYLI